MLHTKTKERIKVVQKLREEGHNNLEIAKILGVRPSRITYYFQAAERQYGQKFTPQEAKLYSAMKLANYDDDITRKVLRKTKKQYAACVENLKNEVVEND